MPKAVELPLVTRHGQVSDFATEDPEECIMGLVNPEGVGLVRQSNNRAGYSVVEMLSDKHYHVALSVEETRKRLGMGLAKA